MKKRSESAEAMTAMREKLTRGAGGGATAHSLTRPLTMNNSS